MHEPLDILIVGAGPTGLACAIEAVARNLKLLVVEKGVLVNSIYNYPSTMTFFTSRERLEIGDLPLPSLNTKPHRAEALEYYRRVADFYRLPIHFQERVMGIGGHDGEFRVETETSEGHRGEYITKKAIIATGYYDLPNLLGIPGEELPKVSHYYTDPHPYYRRKVAVIGGANSAAVAALDLWRHGAEVTLIYREPDAQFAHQILDSARHRKSHQGRLHSRPAAIRGEGDCSRRHLRPSEQRGNPAP